MKRIHISILFIYFISILSISMYHINCKAYTIDNSVVEYRFHWSRSDGANSRIAGINWNANGISDARSIMLYSEDVEELAREYYGENYFIEHTDDYNFILCYKGSLEYVPICNHMTVNDFIRSSVVRDVMGITEQQAGYLSCEIVPITYNNAGENIIETNNYYSVNYGGEQHEQWQYVTSLKDAKKYLIDKNDRVLTTGNPNDIGNQIVNTYNKNIPVPQEVEVYKNSSNPTLVWKNPIISGDSDIQVDIEWNPTIDCLNGRQVIDTLNYGTYMPLYWDSLDDHNAFITKQFETSQISNDLMGYNYILDEKCLYKQGGGSHFSDLSTTNLLQFVETPLIYLMGEDKFNSFNIRKLDYRIRYIIGNEYGDWIYSNRNYGMDNTSPSPHSTTSRRNPSGDPVPNDNYQPNNDPNIINVYASSGDAGSSWWVRFNNDTLSIFNIFTNRINEEQASMVDNDNENGSSDSIFSVVADFFKEFPIFMVFLISGFAVVVFLRIFGR